LGRIGGLDAIRVRIFNCTGPRKVGDALSDFVRRAVRLERHLEARTIRVGNLETRRTIVDVRDLNRGLILLLERGESGEAYNLGGPTAYSMSSVLLQVLKRSTRRDIVPRSTKGSCDRPMSRSSGPTAASSSR
jgi:GDP-4-dehydro-6-deoxy-D-mannose reductase